MNRVKMRMAVWGGVCVAVLLACHSEKSRLEEALEAAGGNRSELEQVLEHYRGDSLKSLAAQFLIENMPCHYAYAGKELEKYRRYFERFPPCAWRGPTFVRDSLVEADGAFCPDSLHKVYDVQVIKSDTLSVISTKLSRYGAGNHGDATWPLPISWNSSCPTGWGRRRLPTGGRRSMTATTRCWTASVPRQTVRMCWPWCRL